VGGFDLEGKKKLCQIFSLTEEDTNHQLKKRGGTDQEKECFVVAYFRNWSHCDSRAKREGENGRNRTKKAEKGEKSQVGHKGVR